MYPKISIITVTYNCEKTISETIDSVINQTYPNIEYIIIDGESTDKTLTIVNNYKDKIQKILSEKDNGIYDAMNKGINLSSGEWIIFINSGDSFASPTILEECFAKDCISNYDDYKVLYGNVILCTTGKRYRLKASPIETLKYQLPFCHQSAFVRADILKEQPFNLNFKIAADYNMFKSFYDNGLKFKHIDKYISCYSLDGGFSHSNEYLMEKEICHIQNISGIRKYIRLLHVFVRTTIINIFPYKLTLKIRGIKYRHNKYIIIND